MDFVRGRLPLPILPLALFSGMLWAADPVRVEYQCSDEDTQSFGLDCYEDRPCPVFLELAAVDALGSRVFVTGNLHTQNTTLYGVLLISDDSGQTWTEPDLAHDGHKPGRIRAAELDQIQFIDLRTGWISGVMLEPLPRDPFLLATSDAGASWRTRPLFDETRFGSIQQFWFTTPSSGELIVDRSQGASTSFERYESNTGGDSWTMAEVNKNPLRMNKPRPKDDPTWRLRVDAASKTYHVERRTVEQTWENIAVFAVSAGECK
jgi:hypothetical protein